MLKVEKNAINETCYEMSNEGKHAALMTTGNGYLGDRRIIKKKTPKK